MHTTTWKGAGSRKKAHLPRGTNTPLFRKAKHMYPGPIRNQAFDILFFIWNAPPVAFMQVEVLGCTTQRSILLLAHEHENAVLEKTSRYFLKLSLYFPKEMRMPFFQCVLEICHKFFHASCRRKGSYFVPYTFPRS